MPSARIVGPGRAGGSLAGALASVGWMVADPVRHGEDPAGAAVGVDLCVIATPDAAIAPTAAAIDPVATTVLAHLAGSLDPSVLGPHTRRAALHPLATLPDPETGAETLAGGCWWAVDGDPFAGDVVAALHGRAIEVPPASRPAYHAAACVAANHLVALMGQVERIAAGAGLPAEPFLELAASALANVRRVGARAALTGPAARGDTVTIERHLAALQPGEHDLYRALAGAATQLSSGIPQS